MVRFNQAYRGTKNVKVMKVNNKIITHIYKGSELVYQLGFNPVTFFSGTTNKTWTVPQGIKKIHIDCVASRGGYAENGSGTAGKGGRVQCDLEVTGGQVLYITVGNVGSNTNDPTYNASDIRIGGTSYSDRIIVAGGGGNAYWRRGSGAGGNGGGTIGGKAPDTSYALGGYGGTQSAGGAGGKINVGGSVWASNGSNGTLALGGGAKNHGNLYAIGGCGGAGYYGGGGGAGAHTSNVNGAAGGGGGSSYTHPTLCSNVVHTQGFSGSGVTVYDTSTTGIYETTLPDGLYLLQFVGPGGGGGSCQRDSKWFQVSGGSGAYFSAQVYLKAGTYKFVVGSPGYGYNVNNTYSFPSVEGTDSYIEYNGTRILTCGCGKSNGGGPRPGHGGDGGIVTIGNIDIRNLFAQLNGLQGNKVDDGSVTSTSGYALSVYDDTQEGYGAGTGSWRYAGNVYGRNGYLKLEQLDSDDSGYITISMI